jgi:outer membrane protein
MKKLSLAAILVAGMVSFASADFLSISAGVGYEQQKVGGYTKLGDVKNYFNKHSAENDGNSNTGNFGLDDKYNPYFWVKFIHPLPVIPNVKFQYTRYDSSGHSNYIAGNVEIFGDFKIPSSLTNATTDMSIDSYDITFFYEFKPVIADIEAGLGLDYWKGHTSITGTSVDTGVTKKWVDEDWSVVLPYLYAHLESMQFFGFSAIGDIKFASLGDNYHHEYMGAVKYTIDIIGPVNPYIKLGYKLKEAYGKDGKNETKIDYRGLFLEAGAKF